MAEVQFLSVRVQGRTTMMELWLMPAAGWIHPSPLCIGKMTLEGASSAPWVRRVRVNG